MIASGKTFCMGSTALPPLLYIPWTACSTQNIREELLNQPTVPLHALDKCYLVRIKDRDTLSPEHVAYCTFAHACMTCQSGPEWSDVT